MAALSIRYEGPRATITLTQPEVRNAFSDERRGVDSPNHHGREAFTARWGSLTQPMTPQVKSLPRSLRPLPM